jgi:DNA replication licensing factor MCM7
MRNFIAKA